MVSAVIDLLNGEDECPRSREFRDLGSSERSALPLRRERIRRLRHRIQVAQRGVAVTIGCAEGHAVRGPGRQAADACRVLVLIVRPTDEATRGSAPCLVPRWATGPALGDHLQSGRHRRLEGVPGAGDAARGGCAGGRARRPASSVPWLHLVGQDSLRRVGARQQVGLQARPVARSPVVVRRKQLVDLVELLRAVEVVAIQRVLRHLIASRQATDSRGWQHAVVATHRPQPGERRRREHIELVVARWLTGD